MDNDQKPVEPFPHSPVLRGLLHFGALAVAFPLTYVASESVGLGSYWGRLPAVVFCLCLTFFNRRLLTKLKWFRSVWRPGADENRGIWLYPFGLAIAFAVFPAFAVGAAWAALAAGDPTAGFVGRRHPRPRLPWNSGKSLCGFAGFFAAAFPFVLLLLWWSPPADGGAYKALLLAVVAAAGGALLESLPGSLDDNLRLALGVSALVWGVEKIL